MKALIIIAILFFIFGAAASGAEGQSTVSRRQQKKNRREYKKEMKRIRKERERAEMEAWEDQYAMFEAMMDD